MATSQTPPDENPHPGLMGDPPDFSLVLGGPLYQLLRKTHLEGDHLELLYRRITVIPLITWLPLLLLALLGSSGESSTRLSFFQDVEVHVRFLVALPILIAAELIVHSRLRPAVRRFVERRIVPLPEMSRFNSAVASAVRLRNSIALEVALVFIVYAVGLWVWNGRVAIDVDTWYARPGGRWHLTLAGIWYVFVSIPILQFILLRWYVRFFIRYRFLWNVARIKLHLIPTHPDRAGGLAFVGGSVYAFGPILFAQGAMLTGLVASRVLYRAENLLSFKLQAIGFVIFFVFAILAPLVMFTPQLVQAKREGLADYGLLAQRYVEGFEQKWVVAPPGEELLGTGDIQSLADLGNSYAVVKEMRIVPFGLQDITRLAIATAAPMAPLLLTIWSPEELVMRIIKVVF
jgi:hypothetical protein